MITVFVDGQDISQIEGISITDRHLNPVPKIDISAYDLARADGMKRVYKRYGGRKFNILGHIITPNRNAAETARNALLGILLNADQTRVITEYAGAQRVLNAECDNPIINELKGGYTTFDLGFTAYNPFIYDQSETVGYAVAAITAASRRDNFPVVGTAPALPKITVTLNSFTGSGYQEISVVNGENDLGITVSRVWTAADVLIVDSENGTVKVNGVEVDYSGTFPTLKPGVRSIQYSDTFTIRSVNIDVRYYSRYF